MDFIRANRLRDQFGLSGGMDLRFDFDFGDVFTGSGRQFVPDPDGDDTTEDRERREEDRPPVPAMARQKAQTERLQAGSQIRAAVNYARGCTRGFSSAEIGRGGAGDQRGNADDGHGDHHRAPPHRARR